MSEDRRITITSNAMMRPDEVAQRTFPAARKGLDPAAVRAYLVTVADELRAYERREEELYRRISEAEQRANTPPELDEGTLAAALGVETTRVLQAAHEAARQVVERAEARAAEVESQAAHLLEQRTAEGEDAARRIREEARAASSALTENARADAERMVEATKAECRAMVGEARQVRARVLRDLTDRRRVLRVQVEQLLAGRSSLLAAVDGVRGAVDDISERLARAEHEARDAADAAAPDTDEVEAAEGLDADVSAAAEAAEAEALFVARAGAVTAAPAEPDERDADLAILRALDHASPPEAGQQANEGPPTQFDIAATPAGEEVAAYAEPVFEGVTVLGVVAGETEAESAATEEASEPEGPSEASKQAVDELFAKIRASRAEQVARAREILEAGEAAAAAEGPAEAGEGAAGQAPASAEAGAEEPEATAGQPAADVTAEVEVAVAPEVPRAEDEGGQDERSLAAFASRDQLLASVIARLARSLKRALQDDQNDLLDRLRSAPPSVSLDELLPQSQQEERYAAAAKLGIDAARKAGVSFAKAELGDGKGAHGDGTHEDARVAARRLSDELVGALRLRIAGCLAAAESEGTGAGADVVGVAYREWKGSRVNEIAGDHATRAFSAAALSTLKAAGDPALRVVWAVDDGGSHCPDCDDNALAGPQTPGERFPTGQQHPPVHPGCRCLLVPVRS